MMKRFVLWASGALFLGSLAAITNTAPAHDAGSPKVVQEEAGGKSEMSSYRAREKKRREVKDLARSSREKEVSNNSASSRRHRQKQPPSAD